MPSGVEKSKAMEQKRFELSTPTLRTWCSSQLSYCPDFMREQYTALSIFFKPQIKKNTKKLLFRMKTIRRRRQGNLEIFHFPPCNPHKCYYSLIVSESITLNTGGRNERKIIPQRRKSPDSRLVSQGQRHRNVPDRTRRSACTRDLLRGHR